MANPVLYRYSDVVFSFLAPYDTLYEHKMPVHVVIYVASGEVVVEDGNTIISAQAGECLFIKRNHRVKLAKRAVGDQPYAAISIRLERSFLKNYFSHLDKHALPERAGKLHGAAVKLSHSPEFDTLFQALMPTLSSPETKPNGTLIADKMRETVEILLHTDEGFYPTLFDFNEPWKIDLMAFMEQNYKQHLSIEEFALYTGRSLATFKRDFSKENDVTPQRWLTFKRLEAAYNLLKKGGKTVSEVCWEVGFVNRTHFISAFKKQYGVPPTGLIVNC